MIRKAKVPKEIWQHNTCLAPSYSSCKRGGSSFEDRRTGMQLKSLWFEFPYQLVKFGVSLKMHSLFTCNSSVANKDGGDVRRCESVGTATECNWTTDQRCHPPEPHDWFINILLSLSHTCFTLRTLLSRALLIPKSLLACSNSLSVFSWLNLGLSSVLTDVWWNLGTRSYFCRSWKKRH